MLSLKIDPRMKAALKKSADDSFQTPSSVVKQLIDRYLKEQNIDWRSIKLKDDDK